MDAKPTKALDEAAFNLKRKRATLHVAPLTGVLAPNSVPSNTQGTPGSPWMPFTTILVAVRNMVPLDNKFQIIQHYEQFVVCKVAQINAYVLNNKGLFDPMVPQIISIFYFDPTINKTYILVPHFFLRLPNKSQRLNLTPNDVYGGPTLRVFHHKSY